MSRFVLPPKRDVWTKEAAEQTANEPKIAGLTGSFVHNQTGDDISFEESDHFPGDKTVGVPEYWEVQGSDGKRYYVTEDGDVLDDADNTVGQFDPYEKPDYSEAGDEQGGWYEDWHGSHVGADLALPNEYKDFAHGDTVKLRNSPTSPNLTVQGDPFIKDGIQMVNVIDENGQTSSQPTAYLDNAGGGAFSLKNPIWWDDIAVLMMNRPHAKIAGGGYSFRGMTAGSDTGAAQGIAVRPDRQSKEEILALVDSLPTHADDIKKQKELIPFYDMNRRPAKVAAPFEPVPHGQTGQGTQQVSYAPGVIVVSRWLTPDDNWILEHEKCVGIVAEAGGKTSHGAVVARARNIPVVVDAMEASQVEPGDELIVNGSTGVVDVNGGGELENRQAPGQEAATGKIAFVWYDGTLLTDDMEGRGGAEAIHFALLQQLMEQRNYDVDDDSLAMGVIYDDGRAQLQGSPPDKDELVDQLHQLGATEVVDYGGQSAYMPAMAKVAFLPLLGVLADGLLAGGAGEALAGAGAAAGEAAGEAAGAGAAMEGAGTSSLLGRGQNMLTNLGPQVLRTGVGPNLLPPNHPVQQQVDQLPDDQLADLYQILLSGQGQNQNQGYLGHRVAWNPFKKNPSQESPSQESEPPESEERFDTKLGPVSGDVMKFVYVNGQLAVRPARTHFHAEILDEMTGFNPQSAFSAADFTAGNIDPDGTIQYYNDPTPEARAAVEQYAASLKHSKVASEGKHQKGQRVELTHPKFKGQHGSILEYKGKHPDIEEEKYKILLDNGEELDDMMESHFKKIKSASFDAAAFDSTGAHFIDTMEVEAASWADSDHFSDNPHQTPNVKKLPPGRLECPHCGSDNTYSVNGVRYQCRGCGGEFRPNHEASLVKEAPGKEHMKGVSPKRNRMYEHVLQSCKEEHPDWDEERCKEYAARTVNKYRAEHGETKGSGWKLATSAIIDSNGNPLEPGHWYVMHSTEYRVPDVVQVLNYFGNRVEAAIEAEDKGHFPISIDESEVQKQGYTFEPYQQSESPELESIASVKEARKNYTATQQRELVNENLGARARNIDKLNLEGTHYPSSVDFDDDPLSTDFLW